jgi:MYXO-CTERM domain-containing protein
MRASPVKRAFPKGTSRASLLRVVVFVLGLVIVSLGAPHFSGVARANNGIPGSLGVLLPLDKPQEIGLATTFGLILSDDGGTSWVWTCEQPATSMANAYTVGAPPADRFYALSPVTGLSFSADESCGWQGAGGALAGQKVSDFFTDPSDPMHVLAAAASPPSDGGGAALAAVYASTDGGATFGATPLYTAPAGASIVGIEIARSDPQVVYLTYVTATSSGYDPGLVRSANGGQTWTTTDLLAPLGSAIVRILAVDSAHSALVYLRAIGATSETLAVTRDGGMTFATPLTVANGALSAFARLASGTVLVGALVNLAGGGGGTMGAGYRSTDGAMTFSPWMLDPEPHLVGLGERVVAGQSKLYLSGKNYSDGWALAVSTDEGMTVTPVMSYDQVAGIKPCVRQLCLDSCNYEETQAIWDTSVCAGTDAGVGDGGPRPAASSGCHCAAGGDHLSGGAGLTGFVLLVAAATARRRRRRDPARTASS